MKKCRNKFGLGAAGVTPNARRSAECEGRNNENGIKWKLAIMASRYVFVRNGWIERRAPNSCCQYINKPHNYNLSRTRQWCSLMRAKCEANIVHGLDVWDFFFSLFWAKNRCHLYWTHYIWYRSIAIISSAATEQRFTCVSNAILWSEQRPQSSKR